MRTGVLQIDTTKVARARDAARNITFEIQKFITGHTTTTTERTILRLLGIDGINEDGVPLPNVVVDNIVAGGGLARGAAYWLGNAMLYHGLAAQEVAEAVARGAIDLCKVPQRDAGDIRDHIDRLAVDACNRITDNRVDRAERIARLGQGQQPWLYVIVATGNIYEDVIQAKAAVKAGADIIAVIRTTGQSLLDYVPYGVEEGFGGTPATQENFRIMRRALDEVGEEVGRYVRLVNYCSGLCMPEIAAMGAIERLDMMLNDSMYGILFRDINPERTFIDQYFSRIINGYAGIIINTGEDNYMTTDDPIKASHTVLASQFINEQFAFRSGLPEEQMGLGHVFAINPDYEDGFLYEVAQAQLTREIFPKATLKYMPPTKYMTGNIYKGHIYNGLHNLSGVLTGQSIVLVGMLAEAVHTPYMHERYLSIENARYIMNDARHLADEIVFRPDGRIAKRANEIVTKAHDMLLDVEKLGLWEAIARGMFAGVKRPRSGGKGAQGVVAKAKGYFNPFIPLMLGTEEGGAAE
jgi:beta-lysine 5,6-aminomutase alpha subunit